MTSGNRKAKKAARQVQADTGVPYTQARRQGLIPKQIRDRNGRLTTVYVRPQDSDSLPESIQDMPLVSTQEEGVHRPSDRDLRRAGIGPDWVEQDNWRVEAVAPAEYAVVIVENPDMIEEHVRVNSEKFRESALQVWGEDALISSIDDHSVLIITETPEEAPSGEKGWVVPAENLADLYEVTEADYDEASGIGPYLTAATFVRDEESREPRKPYRPPRGSVTSRRGGPHLETLDLSKISISSR